VSAFQPGTDAASRPIGGAARLKLRYLSLMAGAGLYGGRSISGRVQGNLLTGCRVHPPNKLAPRRMVGASFWRGERERRELAPAIPSHAYNLTACGRRPYRKLAPLPLLPKHRENPGKPVSRSVHSALVLPHVAAGGDPSRVLAALRE
jgi:hypothetical protein